MHGRGGGEESKRARHMWTVPTRATAVVNDDAGGSPSSSSSSTANYFCKDGRKISVGDCALFKPAQDSPPFIGIIRCLTTGKENKVTLGVNWLYRPAEVKLGKGILLDAAPNEVFYSFHKDETPAASLLHPCKVAFLPKGIELPSGISSFVCRRVYDITYKCLWWLTDQNYINELQEEVDQLLYKTRLEMHVTVQPGGRSPKPTNGPMQTSQLKHGSDSVQNSASSFSSQAKGKKRERVDQGSDPVKRERSSKVDAGDSSHSRPEVSLKSEIAKITENGGLEDPEAVEKLVQLMVPDRIEKKIDLVSRSMLASVVAATEKFDCLSRFVHLKGLPVFDEWLQEVHRGKVSDVSGSKENEKSIEEFLLILLRALDKLPVNLQALQMCNIGKSVNHLRTHKNLEIQKKARSLVDTWKKRVEAEMDAKSGSNQTVPWPSRTRLPEVSHNGSKHSVSSEVANKSSVTQISTPRTGPVKLAQTEATTKSAALPGLVKAVLSPVSAGTNTKDGQSRNTPVAGCGIADPLTNARDEKSSSSSQSHNNSQSYSSDQAKTAGFRGKEDVRSSAAGSAAVNKISGCSSRQRKSSNGYPGSSGAQREMGSNKSSFQRNLTAEKLVQSAIVSDKVDVAMVEGGNHKLIVKIPNRGRSPAQSASGGSVEDHSVTNSRASSPVPVEKNEQNDCNLKERSDTYRANVTSEVNTESWQSNDFKDVLTGSDDGDGSPAGCGDEHCRVGEDSRRTPEVSKTGSSSSGNDLKSSKPKEAPFSSINVLIDSCVKFSEANMCVPVGDDTGMNLLASVAAGEMSKSEMGTPVESPQRNVDYPSIGDDARLKSSYGDDLAARDPCQSLEGTNCEHQKQGGSAGMSWTKNGNGNVSHLREKSTGNVNRNASSSSLVLHQASDLSLENGRKEDSDNANACAPGAAEKASVVSDDKELVAKKPGGELESRDDNSTLDLRQQGVSSLVHENKLIDQCIKTEAEVDRGSMSVPSSNPDMENNKISSGVLDRTLRFQQKTSSNEGNRVATVVGPVEAMLSPNGNATKAEMDKETAPWRHGSCSERQKPESETAGVLKDEHMEENMEVVRFHRPEGGSSPSKPSSSAAASQSARSKGSKSNGVEVEDADEPASTTTEAPSSVTAGSDLDAKVEFDLNEGLNADGVKYSESSNFSLPGQLVSPLPFPFSSVSSSLPASITITAAAKKPFVPPDDLLRTKGVLGWKGSAATSAFRPAEPRRSLDTPLGTSNISFQDASSAKQCKPPLDIDLNVPDERVLEDLSSRGCPQVGSSKIEDSNNFDSTCGFMGSSPARSSGGLDLDLNRVDEPIDLANQFVGSNGHRLDISLQSVRSSAGGILKGETSVRRDFDLNNGPVADEVTTEPLLFGQQSRSSSMQSKPTVSSFRVNGSEMANLASWFPTGNPYSAVTVPAFMPDRVEQPFPIVATAGTQRVLGQGSGVTYNPDVYRAPVLQSSPAAAFPSGPFQYPVFPFGTTSYPIPSTSFSSGSTTYVDSASNGRLCFPTVHSQFLGPAGAIASSYPRPPYVVSIPDAGNSSGVDGGRKWGRQGLDLNAGPGGPDIEARDEMSRQHPVGGTQVLAEEQARIYPFVGGVLKRKEPDGGWDGFKQSSWQ